MPELSLVTLEGSEEPWVVLEGRTDSEWLAATEMVHLEDHR